jgi:protein SCO1/2
MRRRFLLAAMLTSVLATGALAHGVEDHSSPPVAILPQAVTPLPWEIGGAYDLIDHTGAPRSQVDPEGRMQLIFFGYANCPGICSAALPMMADAIHVLARRGIAVTPVLITIDPELDRVETMGPALGRISADLVGLTGSRQALSQAYDAFRIEFQKIMDDPEHGPIYAHGSYIYLLDPMGEVLTLLPPVLPPDQVAEIVARYAGR